MQHGNHLLLDELLGFLQVGERSCVPPRAQHPCVDVGGAWQGPLHHLGAEGHRRSPCYRNTRTLLYNWS